MTWFALYETATGRLTSVGTVVTDPLPPGLTKKNLGANRPPDTEMWDEVTKEFIPRPVKVLVDRFDDDLLMHVQFVQFQNVYNGLNPGQKKQVRGDLITWLGGERFRNKNTSVIIRDPSEDDI
ncbi:hypothetical protein LCGC14_3050920 [marine sediment metagenome]|uniref:Uncharacterized protein n=1 Tax=marine sediment metagenome TaxID=412755 RepID=A0A0F8WLN3_9ZZZZ